MRCNWCAADKPAGEFGPSAPSWPDRRVCKRCARDHQSRRKHGITPTEKQIIADAQGGCRICGHTDPGTKGWSVDHDHECCAGSESCPKCRRGVVSTYCNHMLGSAFDMPRILRAGADYLERARDCSWHMPVACAPRICGGHAPSIATDVTDRTDGTDVEGSQLQNMSHFSNAPENAGPK